MSSSHNSSHDDHHGHAKVYLFVFIALLILTFITVYVSRFDFGNLNLPVAMAIASVKAFLVAFFFMHLREENGITRFYAFVPLLLLAILIAGVFIDNPYRVPAKTQPVAKVSKVIKAHSH